MKKFIFGKRNGIYIIDLQKTLKQFKEASKFVTDLAASGKNLLFVGTKRQAQDAIYEEANRCGMFYVNTRWLGGTLTNFTTIRKSIHRLKEIEGDPRAGRQREPDQEGAPAPRAREGEAPEEPRGHQGDGRAAGRALRRSTRSRSTSRSRKRTSWGSRSWPSWTPTAIRTWSTTSSRATTTPSARSGSSRLGSPTRSSRGCTRRKTARREAAGSDEAAPAHAGAFDDRGRFGRRIVGQSASR